MKIRKLFHGIQFNTHTIPLYFLGISLLAFGLLTFRLGYFQDDWHHVYSYATEGMNGLRNFLSSDSRPFAIIVYGFLFKLLGTNPALWHILFMFVRFAVALAAWLNLNLLWQNPKRNAFIACLFLVYPTFLLQSMSVAYALHWLMYLAFMISILCMLAAFRNPRYFILLTVLSLLLQIFHLLMIEYFVGLEIARVIIIWLILPDQPLRKRFQKTAMYWLPYLFVLAAYIGFRSSYSQVFGYDRNVPNILLNLFTTPFETLRFLIETALQDITEILFSGWYEVLKPQYFDFDYFSTIFLWAAALGCGLITGIYFYLLKDDASSDQHNQHWQKTAIWTGLLLTLLGSLPTWAIGDAIVKSNPLWNDRYTLPSMLGAAIFWTGLIYKFIPIKKHRVFCFSVLISLAVMLNLRTELSFKQAWEKQVRFYWQLYWRAPAIAPGTALVSDSEFLGYMGHYPTAFAINTIYPKTLNEREIDYWFYVGEKQLPIDWQDFREGKPISIEKYGVTFNGNTLDTITVTYEPENSQCMWLLRPEDVTMYWLRPALLKTLPVSNLSLISSNPKQAGYPDPGIFGKEPTHTWCYFYQKAELARQEQDWQLVTQLWDEAEAFGFRPKVAYEYLPFVEGFAMSGDWNSSLEISKNASKLDFHMPEYLCNLWEEYEKNSQASEERDSALRILRTDLSCTQ
jgi:hypothetical protein